MDFDPVLAEQRFGYGLSPRVAAPSSVGAMLAGLTGADRAQAAYPIASYRSFQDAHVLRRRFRTYARKHPDTDVGKQADEKARGIQRDMRAQNATWFTQWQLRRINTEQAFRERLVSFWADHFTARGKGGLLRWAAPLYVDEAVRPHISGRFGDLLFACVTHPLMLHYLDQNASVGPNSALARRRDRPLGLNENLAREVLELHTIGVDAPYDQGDVRELAELFTGLAATRDYGFKYRKVMAEPGAETVLGKTYAAKPSLNTIRAVLNDLAIHPATARHIARKLAVHFVGDDPAGSLVAQIETAFLESDGDLTACYTAMLANPEAWVPARRNMRTPDEFLSAALRALDVSAATLEGLDLRGVQKAFYQPLTLMGQPWLAPAAPDGFAEDDAAWITPQGISARLEWAMNAPARLQGALPEPIDFARQILGGVLNDRLKFAIEAAENRQVAIGIVLASPAFQRR